MTKERTSDRLVLAPGGAAALPAHLGFGLDGRRVAVVTDREVGALHLDAFTRPLTGAGARCCPVTVDTAGSAKSLDAVKTVIAQLSDNGFTQGDLLVGLGGGGVLDIARFSAFLYRGGLFTAMVPTSLSSMVAAGSIERACLNFSGSKDMLSVPAVPGLTVVDPVFLDTLPKRQFANGMAEIIRLAYLADPDLLEQVENGALSKEDMVRRAIAASDKARAGNPDFLGFGRQVGDVIEEHFRFIKYFYGEVCALGMLAVSPSPRLSSVLERFGLPLRMEGVGAETLGRKMVKAFYAAGLPGAEESYARVAVADEPGCPAVRTIPRDEADAWFAAAVARIAG